MNAPGDSRSGVHRRAFLSRASLGSIALASFLRESFASVAPHHAPRAKRVIWLYMSGGPSHLETFDSKPKLKEMHGKPMPESFTNGQPIAQLQKKSLRCLAPQFPFERHGQSGIELTSQFPNIARVADDIAVIRSMVTDAINHDPAHTLMNTGTTISGRPSMGAWALYGLGNSRGNLPGFVVITSTEGRSPQPISARMWHSGFLPGQHQGVELRSKGDPVLYAGNPHGINTNRQRDVITAVKQLNDLQNSVVDDPEIAVRIAQYELAFGMQTSIPELMDISKEPQQTLDLYGAKPGTGSFAANCILARRLAERGVRFIQLYHRDWDHHNDIAKFLPQNAANVDRATAALITDLRQRGLLDDTLIVWGGEFGRTPMAQTDKGGAGRDHHMKGFSTFLCGGGIQGGVTHGATDDLGYNAVQDIVHVNDLHATMLHLLGIDHRRLTFRFQGRDFRLTDVAGNVIKPILS